MERRRNRGIVKTIVLIFIALIQLYPLFWLFLFSLKSNVDILLNANILGWPAAPQWENYATVLLRSTIPTYLLNSVIYSGATVLVVGILTAMAAYAIARMRWKLSGATLMLFVVGIMIPTHAALLPLYQVLEGTGMRNTPYVGLILVYVAFAIPMSTMILVSFYKSIPRELEEAAFIDGCNIYRSFGKIMLPLIMPALATASIFTVMGTWNDLLFVQTYVDVNSLKTITVGVLDFVGRHSTRLGLIGAGLVVATIPVILVYIFFSDKIQKSLLEGAVKG